MHKLRYRAVLFDVDGTLIDSEEDLMASVKHGLRQVEGRRPPPDDVIIMEVGKPLEVMLGNLGHPSDDETAVHFAASYPERYANHFTDHTRLFPSLKEVLTFLGEAGAKLALVTTMRQSQAELTVEGVRLRGYFTYVHGWREGLRHKPDLESVRTTLEKPGAQPREALMAGDSEQDIVAAQAAGVATCAATYGFRPPMLLRALKPDYMIARITDLVHIVLGDA